MSLQIIWRTEIELKKNSLWVFGSLVEVYRTIEQVVGKYRKYMSRTCRSISGSKLLVFYTILYFANSHTLSTLVFQPLIRLFAKFLPKSGNSSIPPPKDRHCLPIPKWKLKSREVMRNYNTSCQRVHVHRND